MKADFLEQELPWIQKGEQLFKEGKEYGDFAYYGWGGISNQLYGYVEGYKKAADTLVDTAVESNDIRMLDTLVYPICFCYRQYLELVLKNLYLSFAPDTTEEKEQTIKGVSHSLKRIWDKVKPIIEHYSYDSEKEDVHTAESYILQFDYFDKDSFSFRYPITKRLELIHSCWRYLDLVNLKDRINELYNFFNGVEGAIDERKEVESELHLYYTEND